MSIHTMDELLTHRDHVLEVVNYVNMKGESVNASIKCVSCGCILVSIDSGEFLGVEELTDYEKEKKFDYMCCMCGEYFNYDPEHEPHSVEGQDCHEKCCPICNSNDEFYRGILLHTEKE